MPTPREFYKMSGSGNDFVIFEALGSGLTLDDATIRRLCARGTGIGADGLVILEPSVSNTFQMKYFNADASPAFCGNASLCSARLAVELGAADPGGFRFDTPGGELSARIRDGLPEIDLQPVDTVDPGARVELGAGERRVGFARVGVPHLVVLCDDVSRVPLAERGPALRPHPALEDGANVNFVSPHANGGWAMRTFERGVEGETLACGSGAVAISILLAAWGEAGEETWLLTRSGCTLRVTHRREATSWHPSLSGEGRIVFRGVLEEY